MSAGEDQSGVTEEQEESLMTKPSVTTPEDTKQKKEEWLILKTVCIYWGFMCLGMSQSVLGSSFADTEEWLSIDTSHMSAAFTANSVGYLAGSLLVSLIYDRFRPEAQLGLATALVAVTTAIAPMYKNLVWFITLMALQGIGMAYIDSGSQAYCLSVWRGHRLQDSIIQGIFMAWSVGSSLCPVILQPFLSSEDYFIGSENKSTHCTEQSNSNTSLYHQPINTGNYTVTNLSSENTTDRYSNSNLNQVAYGYLTVGLILTPVTIFYFVLYFLSSSSVKEESDSHLGKEDDKYNDLCKMLLIGQMSFFFLVYVGLEVGYGGLISLYVIRAFCLSNQDGAMMTSLFWGSTGIGRLLGVPVSMFLQPVQMLCANVLLILASLITMAALVETYSALLWVSVVSAGIGMSTVYPSAYLWCSRYIKITGKATAVFNVGGSVGSMVLPLVTGILIDIVSPRAFIYAMLALGASLTLFYLFIFSYIKFCMVKIRKTMQLYDCDGGTSHG